jgi:hypothetical protein
MTQYMISVIHGDLDFSPEELETVMGTVDAFNTKYADQIVFAGGLEPPTAATKIDNTGSDLLVTDGPFTESKEQLGGFWVMELDDMDVALKVAAEASKACDGAVELRPFQSEPPA